MINQKWLNCLGKADTTGIAIVMHLVVILLGYYVLFYTGHINVTPKDSNLIRYDARWYNDIIEEGYVYEPNIGNGLAFFPLFPIIWKVSMLDGLGIAVFNFMLFAAAFIFLLKKRGADLTVLLLLLSFPSLIFFGLPYSESIFFTFCAMILVGYRKRNNRLIMIGFFGASMTRSVCMLFVPAIAFCELLDFHTLKTQRLLNGLRYFLSTVSGFLLAAIYMAHESGKWFYFIDIQKYWNRQWLPPHIPFTTFNPERVLGLDAIAFILGTLAALTLAAGILQNLVNRRLRRKDDHQLQKSVMFSCFFLAGMTIIDTGFTHYLNGSSNIWSLNRHALCTAFAIEFIAFVYLNYWPKKTTLCLIAGLILSGLFFTGIYHYATFPALFFYLLFFSVFITLKYFSASRKYFLAYYIIAVFLQLSFYQDFLHGIWVG